MTALLTFLAIIFVMVIIAGPIVFLQTRRIFREQKNYERGLKVVPLLIHLPPPSDDTELGNRDIRDVTEETISKAQIIYNIIASTFKKGFKSGFYGQRHFAFEIVGEQGFINYFAAVPVGLVEVVKQAINSAYPTARLEEVAEHNIFSPVGRISGTLGGELSLKEKFAYPIATYQDLKRDGMQSLLNALSSLGKEDGAAIQFLMRPANPGWRKAAQDVAEHKRKGHSSNLSMGGLAKDIVTALNKPPEGSKEEEKKPDLSNLEQSTLDAIDEKTRHPGYEVVIRVVVSSNIAQRAEAILANIVASFSLYDAPGKNGFKYTPAKDIDGLVTAYIMRFFPQHNNKNILNSVELATLFHFPDERAIPTSQLARQQSKQVDGPRNIPEEGLLLGYNLFRGAKKPIRLSLQDRQRHMYVVGQTGTGKSTFLENLALQDMLYGNGFAFVDPHGDTAERLLSMVPKERTEDVIYFSPADMDYPMGLNLFEFSNPDQKDFLIQEALNMLYKLYDPQHQGIMGPRYEHIFRNAALTVMADPQGGTFVDIPKLFRDPAFVKQKLQHVADPHVREFWEKEIPQSQRSNEFGEVTSWFVSKFGAFLSNEMMRNIIGQTKSAFDLRQIMDNKKILLVNLSKGRTGELNSKLLGMVFVMKFQAAAMSRADIDEDKRVDFSLYVDEFQNFSTDSFATILSEARKYHLSLIVANQFTTQLTQEIRDAVFGNTGTIVSFRIGQNDVETVGKYFQPTFDNDDLLRIPNYNAVVRTLIGGIPTQPFSMVTLPALGTPNPRLAQALKQLSAAKYGRPKASVEKEINERIATAIPASTSAFGAAANRPLPPPQTSGNFLDDWLNKRQQAPSRSTNNRAIAPSTGVSPGPQPNNLPLATQSPPPANPLSQPQSPVLSSNQVVNAAQSLPASRPMATPAMTPQPSVSTTVPAPSVTTGNSQPVPIQPSPLQPAQSQSSPTLATRSASLSQVAPQPTQDNDQVHKIAEELKKQLDNPTDSSKPLKPLTLNKQPVDEQPSPDDTIYIDRDGAFRQTKP